ncbi:unnamed protein product [Blepharisma stoltei]|uniref:EF-hand domain-containing protein n=1 Tax=Blepharisma stoltei TaxID=1481888 RepID=A0AAU9JU44_9CILI|nr:unnamed protein product [Blepharisma stoltei]
MPQANFQCNSIMFNGNILISGCWQKNLLLYSIDIDSFSIIPYEFARGKRKILINADRIYLIECNEGGDIYESEIGSYTNWRPTGKTSTINYSVLQVYCTYNEGYIYIGIDGSDYFKFDLDEERLIASFDMLGKEGDKQITASELKIAV